MTNVNVLHLLRYDWGSSGRSTLAPTSPPLCGYSPEAHAQASATALAAELAVLAAQSAAELVASAIVVPVAWSELTA